ncbi:MAG: hypothetical protein M1832_000322 [Thelocarpon impressellum]|nr:MAG: hypothetical protein M1832_000322 [Thelocarpon impressellum]
MTALPRLARWLPSVALRQNFCVLCAAPTSSRAFASGRRKAPSVRRAQAVQQQQQSTPPPLQTAHLEASLPPPHLLASAKLSGVLTIEVQAAYRFLRAYLSLGAAPQLPQVRRLCEEHNIDAAALTSLALISNRAASAPPRQLAKALLLGASALGDPGATITLVSQALRTAQISAASLGPALHHLAALSSTHQNPQAQLLQAQLHERRGATADALALYAAVAQNAAADGDTRADGHLALGLLRQKTGDAPGAAEAFRAGALGADDARCYHLLARTLPADAPERLLYASKAAASGVAAAAYDVALLYREGRGQMHQGMGEVERGRLADEFLALAAAGGYSPDETEEDAG